MGGDDARDDLAGVDALVERGDADPERIGVTGGSYGGYMSCWLPVVDQRFKAAVAISPVTDYYSQHWNSNIGAWDSWFLGGRPEDGAEHYRERSPVFFADRVTTPTLLTAGTEDRCTPPGQAMEFYRALARTGRAGRGGDLPGRRTRGEEVPRVSRPGHALDGLVRAVHARGKAIDGASPRSGWRDEFPVLERKTYLISASLGPVSRRSKAYLRGVPGRVGHQGRSRPRLVRGHLPSDGSSQAFVLRARGVRPRRGGAHHEHLDRAVDDRFVPGLLRRSADGDPVRAGLPDRRPRMDRLGPRRRVRRSRGCEVPTA